jgi:hypothetical protein
MIIRLMVEVVCTFEWNKGQQIPTDTTIKIEENFEKSQWIKRATFSDAQKAEDWGTKMQENAFFLKAELYVKTELIL